MRISDANAYGIAKRNCYRNCNCDSHGYSYSDRNCYANGNGNPNRKRYGHGNSYSHGDRNGYWYSNGYSGAEGYSVAEAAPNSKGPTLRLIDRRSAIAWSITRLVVWELASEPREFLVLCPTVRDYLGRVLHACLR